MEVEKFEELTPGIKKDGMQKAARNSAGQGSFTGTSYKPGDFQAGENHAVKTVKTETGAWNQRCEAEDKAGRRSPAVLRAGRGGRTGPPLDLKIRRLQ